ncbi:MAG: Ig-like domain-containing protein [Eubacterium sp.]|nr:Ig-like domain-containing protein [Eubacterium sp.]
MTKKTLRKGAFALTLTLAAATVGGISPTDSQATVREIRAAEEDASWKTGDDWIAAEDTTVTDEVRKMIMDSFVMVCGAGRTPVMYLGYRTTASGTDHCVLCKAFPVVPDPAYTYVLYYVHEKPSGTYEIYESRVLKPSEYADYSVIGASVTLSDFYKYDYKNDTYLYFSGKKKHRIVIRKDGSDEKPDRDASGEGLRILSTEGTSGYYIEDADYSADPGVELPGMIINGTEYAFENGRIYLSSVPEATRYEITMAGAEKPIISVSLNKKKVTLKKGKKVTLKADSKDETGDTIKLIWKSSNKKVATVKNGVITAKKKGSCKITCRIKGKEEAKATCKIVVK